MFVIVDIDLIVQQTCDTLFQTKCEETAADLAFARTSSCHKILQLGPSATSKECPDKDFPVTLLFSEVTKCNLSESIVPP